MSSSGQISVEIALTGADAFGTAVDGVSGKLKTLSQDATSAGGSQGLGALGTGATSATTPVNNLSTGATSLATKIGAISGVVATTAGGILGLASAHEALIKAQTQNEKTIKNINTAQLAANKADEAVTKAMKDGTATAADYEKALGKISDASKKVGDDEQRVMDDESKLNDLRAKGKENTRAYSDLLHKLGDDQGTLTKDTGKLTDSQKAYTDLVQKHVDMTGPKMTDLLLKQKAAHEQLKIAVDKNKDSTDSLKLANDQFILSIGQTALGAIGGVANAIAIFSRNTGPAVQGMKDMETEASSMPLKMGIIGIALAAISAVLLAIATNFGGFRDKLESLGKQIGDSNPALKGLMEVLHGIGGEIGLTGKGFGSGTDEIVKGSKDIGDAAKNFNPLKEAMKALGTIFPEMAAKIKPDIDKLQSAISDFFAHPSGKTALDLGKALYDAFIAGFDYVYAHLPAMITTLGEKLNAALKAGMPKLDQVGAAIITGIQSAVDAMPGAVDKILKAIQSAFTAKGQDAFKKMATDSFNAFVAEGSKILGTLFDPKNTPQLHAALDKLLADLGQKWNTAMTTIKTAWDTFITAITNAWKNSFIAQAVTELAKIPTAVTTAITTIKTAWDTFITAVTNAWKTTFIAAAVTELAKIPTAINTAITTIKTAWDAFITAVTNAWKNSFIGTAITELAKLPTAITTAITTIKSAWDTFITAVTNAWKNSFIAAAVTEIGKLPTAVTTAITTIKTAWDTFITAISNAWKNTFVGTAVTDMAKIPTAVNTAISTMKGAWDTFVSGLKSTWDGLVTDVLGGIQKIVTAVQQAAAALASLAGAQGQGGGPPGNPQGSSPYGPVPGQIPRSAGNQGTANQAAYTGGGNPYQQTSGYYGGPPTGTFGWAAATYAPNAPVNTAAPNPTILITIDGRNVATALKPYLLSGSGALS